MRVGTPGQVARTLISTSLTTTLVVLSDTCPDDSSCSNSRGGTVNFSQSRTWNDEGSYDLGSLEANLGYPAVHVQSGLDQIGLGLDPSLGPTLDSQVVSGTVADLYDLGYLGLSVLPSNFSSPQRSFFTSLRNKNPIPSLSWSYTAGARYRTKAHMVA